MRDPETAAGAQLTIAIITAETSAFPDMQHFLAPRFTAVLAHNEKQIQSAVEDPNVRAILLDLDNVGEDTAGALRLMQEIRQIRDDLVLVAITRSNSRTIPMKASQENAARSIAKTESWIAMALAPTQQPAQ
jgi:DNA-binding NtrC family response regulator